MVQKGASSNCSLASSDLHFKPSNLKGFLSLSLGKERDGLCLSYAVPKMR